LLIQILMELTKVRDDISEQSIDDILDSLHVEFGVALLKRWEFPSNFIDVARDHHNYDRMRDYTLDTQIVSYANLLTRRMGMSLHDADKDVQEMTALGKLLGIQQQQIEPMINEITSFVAEMADMV
jgi:HD-like signal output (HDOD) protein